MFPTAQRPPPQMYALARIDNSFPYQKKTAPYGAAFLVYAQMARAALRASPVASMELPLYVGHFTHV